MKYLKSLFGRLSLHRAGLESLDLGLYKSCNVCPGATFNRSAADTLTLLSFDVIDRNSSDLKLDEFVFKIFYHFSFFFYFEKKKIYFFISQMSKASGPMDSSRPSNHVSLCVQLCLYYRARDWLIFASMKNDSMKWFLTLESVLLDRRESFRPRVARFCCNR